MRNTVQYPITKEEKINLLQKLITETIEENAKNLVCGDMTASILIEIKKDIETLT